MLLLTAAEPTLRRYTSAHLGRLIQPRHYSSIELTAEGGRPWAADNDAFGNFDQARFEGMLGRIGGLPGCRFVACPDVVADAAATAELFDRWAPQLRRLGLPVALVAQDGLTVKATPWRRFQALFVGGSTDWKLGAEAAELIAEAQRRGKHVHVGRVNSYDRLEYARALGVDSVDGSSWTRWRDTYLPGVLHFLATGRRPAQTRSRPRPRGQLRLEGT